MKKTIMFVVSLAMLLSASSILIQASYIDASEPASLETVTLRIEGMT